MGISRHDKGLFRLTVGDHTVMGRPTRKDIKQTVAMLDDDPELLLTLESAPGYFMRCSGDSGSGYYFEYREGHDRKHFRSRSDSVTPLVGSKLLYSYSNENNRWRNMIPWKPLLQMSPQADAAPAKKKPPPVHAVKKKWFWIYERYGNSIVFNKRFCLIMGGVLYWVVLLSIIYLIGPPQGRHGPVLSFQGIATLAGIGLVLMIICVWLISGWIDD